MFFDCFESAMRWELKNIDISLYVWHKLRYNELLLGRSGLLRAALGCSPRPKMQKFLKFLDSGAKNAEIPWWILIFLQKVLKKYLFYRYFGKTWDHATTRRQKKCHWSWSVLTILDLWLHQALRRHQNHWYLIIRVHISAKLEFMTFKSSKQTLSFIACPWIWWVFSMHFICFYSPGRFLQLKNHCFCRGVTLEFALVSTRLACHMWNCVE